MQISNSKESQFANNNGDGDYPHYHNNYPYDHNHNRDYLYSQSTSNLYSTYQRPPSMPYRQPNRPFPRFPSLRFNNYRQPNENYPNFYGQRLPNRHSISNYRNQNSKRQVINWNFSKYYFIDMDSIHNPFLGISTLLTVFKDEQKIRSKLNDR